MWRRCQGVGYRTNGYAYRNLGLSTDMGAPFSQETIISENNQEKYQFHTTKK